MYAASLWASDSFTGANSVLFELDSVTGAVLSSIPGPGTFADALSFSNDGQSIFVLDSSTNSTVYQINIAGAVLNSFNVALDAEGLTILEDGSLVIGGGVSNTIAFVNPLTGAINSQFAPSSQIFGLSSNGVDRLYGLRINGTIDTYDLTGNLLGSLVTGAPGTTLGLAFTGSSFFVSSTGSTVREYSTTGVLLNTFAGPGPFTEGLDFPTVQGPGPRPEIPEPGTMGLAAGAGIVLLAFRRKAARRS
jgi:hypothetical protein